jgi:hypothetical protein
LILQQQMVNKAQSGMCVRDVDIIGILPSYSTGALGRNQMRLFSALGTEFRNGLNAEW